MKLEEIFPEGLKGIIFDCDGVMIDSLHANRHMYNLVLTRLHLPPMTDEQERFAFQATAIQALRNMIPEHLHYHEAEYLRDLLDYDKEVLPKIKLMPGFENFIRHCHAYGLKLAIDTNRTDYGISRILDFFGLPNYFDPVITCSNHEPKPASDGARDICQTWHVKPQQVLFVGDSEDDKKAATGAGCVFAAFGGRDSLSGEITPCNYEEFGQKLWPFLESQSGK